MIYHSTHPRTCVILILKNAKSEVEHVRWLSVGLPLDKLILVMDGKHRSDTGEPGSQRGESWGRGDGASPDWLFLVAGDHGMRDPKQKPAFWEIFKS